MSISPIEFLGVDSKNTDSLSRTGIALVIGQTVVLSIASLCMAHFLGNRENFPVDIKTGDPVHIGGANNENSLNTTTLIPRDPVNR